MYLVGRGATTPGLEEKLARWTKRAKDATRRRDLDFEGFSHDVAVLRRQCRRLEAEAAAAGGTFEQRASHIFHVASR